MLREDLEKLIEYYKYDDSIPVFRLQALLDADEAPKFSNAQYAGDSYRTGIHPNKFLAIPSQAEGGRCIE